MAWGGVFDSIHSDEGVPFDVSCHSQHDVSVTSSWHWLQYFESTSYLALEPEQKDQSLRPRQEALAPPSGLEIGGCDRHHHGAHINIISYIWGMNHHC
eukprot:scaffold37993_cov59-Attheya_sp.AAC.4